MLTDKALFTFILNLFNCSGDFRKDFFIGLNCEIMKVDIDLYVNFESLNFAINNFEKAMWNNFCFDCSVVISLIC